MQRKYTVIVSKDIYCSSTGHYNATCQIVGKGRDKRTVDLHGLRIMRHDSPATYKGYPKYVLEDIARQLKEAWDNSEINVYEYTQDDNRRYDNLRYHDAHRLQFLINSNWRQFED